MICTSTACVAADDGVNGRNVALSEMSFLANRDSRIALVSLYPASYALFSVANLWFDSSSPLLLSDCKHQIIF